MEFTKEKPQVSRPVIGLPEQKCNVLDDEKDFDDKRVWIGNIDKSVAEYVLLKLAQQHGQLTQFDYLYHHKDGPDKGKPRGFCFVTYTDASSASKAIKQLHGYKLRSRHLTVRLANSTSSNQRADNLTNSASMLANNKLTEILALEAKLQTMESVNTGQVKTKLTQSIAPPSLLRIETRKPPTNHESHNKSRHSTNHEPCSKSKSNSRQQPGGFSDPTSGYGHRAKPYDRH